MNVKPSAPCPCGTAAPYAECCRPLHRGAAVPRDAAALMRSRYSAFVTGEFDYLAATLHSDHEDRRTRPDGLADTIRRSAQSLRYLGLRILDTGHEDDGRYPGGVALVLFVVRVFEKGKDRSFIELSRFASDHSAAWRYLEGDSRPWAGPLPPAPPEASEPPESRSAVPIHAWTIANYRSQRPIEPR